MDLDAIKEGILKGSKIAVARAITLAETDKSVALQLFKLLPKQNSKAFVIGITGPPGVGKSTLIGRLAIEFSKRNFKVGIIANDPSSPFSGGAILGNRIRMSKEEYSGNIFIRSLTTKGALGGISWVTEAVTKILETAGYSIIILETVGAGQTDIEISRLADLVMVLVMPELGDEIQALKAGILEIADLIILNKADLPNAQQSYIKYRLTIPKEIPMFKISALNNEGITQLVDYIMQRIKEGNFNVSRKKERIKDSLIKLTSLQLVYEIMKFLPETILTDFIDNILNRNITLDDASQDLAKLIKEKYLKI